MLGDGQPIRVVKHGERLEPLLGIYEVSLADLIEMEIEGGKGRVFRVLEKADMT